jgi:chorismate lyase/3-hydroxybenzoate synthase
VPDAQTLAIVSYGESSSVDLLDHRRLTVGLPVLHGNQLHEVWQSDQPVETGWLGDISYRCTGRLLFGQVLLDDSNYAGMEGLTRHIYQQIMALQTSMEFPHLLRIWNYFPWINRDAEGLERYRAFCVGRHQAIDTSSGYERHLPSASAIGTRGDKTLVYFLASRKPGNQIENPRQISAFDYPDQYSPKSPAFSRAMLVQWDPGIQLYISGTASIIGHQTYHRHDYIRQLGECLNNIDTLVTRARNENGLNIHSCADLTSIKIYLRHPEYLEHAMHYVNDRLGTGAPVVYLRGDICRSDLLLEVEGLYSSC